MGGHLSQRIEVLGVTQPAAGFVVIAADDRTRHAANAIDRQIGIRAVPYEIPETKRLIVIPLREFEAGVEGFEIRVDIA